MTGQEIGTFFFLLGMIIGVAVGALAMKYDLRDRLLSKKEETP